MFLLQMGQNIEIDVSQDGKATFHRELENLKLSEIIGRSIVIHEGDLDSLKLGNTQR